MLFAVAELLVVLAVTRTPTVSVVQSLCQCNVTRSNIENRRNVGLTVRNVCVLYVFE